MQVRSTFYLEQTLVVLTSSNDLPDISSKYYSRKQEVTGVKLYEGVDVQVAMTTKCGDVVITSFSLDISQENRKIRRKWVMKKVHSSFITCAHWSVNGMKLMTSDESGKIKSCEIDFNQNCCSCNEVMDISQKLDTSSPCNKVVSIHYRLRYLLLLTRDRCHVIVGDDVVRLASDDDVITSACYNDDVIHVTRHQLRVLTSSRNHVMRVYNVTGSLLETHDTKLSRVTLDDVISLDDASPTSPRWEDGSVVMLMTSSNVVVASSRHAVQVYDTNDLTNTIARVVTSRQIDDVIITSNEEVFVFFADGKNGERKISRISTKNRKRLTFTSADSSKHEENARDNIEKHVRTNLLNFQQKLLSISSEVSDVIGNKVMKQIEDVGENLKKISIRKQQDDEVAISDKKKVEEEEVSEDFDDADVDVDLVASTLQVESRKAKKRKKRKIEKQSFCDDLTNYSYDDATTSQYDEVSTSGRDGITNGQLKTNDITAYQSDDATTDQCDCLETDQQDDVTTSQFKVDKVSQRQVDSDGDDPTTVASLDRDEEEKIFRKLVPRHRTLTSSASSIVVTSQPKEEDEKDLHGDEEAPDDVSDVISENDEDDDSESVEDVDIYARTSSSDDVTDHDPVTNKQPNDDEVESDDDAAVISNRMIKSLSRNQIDCWKICKKPQRGKSEIKSIYAHGEWIFAINDKYQLYFARDETSSNDDVIRKLKWRNSGRKNCRQICMSASKVYILSRSGEVAVAPTSGGNLRKLKTSRFADDVTSMCANEDSDLAWLVRGGQVFSQAESSSHMSRVHVNSIGKDGVVQQPKISSCCVVGEELWLLSLDGAILVKSVKNIENSALKWSRMELRDDDDGRDVTITVMTSHNRRVYACDASGRLWMWTSSNQWWQIHMNEYVDVGAAPCDQAQTSDAAMSPTCVSCSSRGLFVLMTSSNNQQKLFSTRGALTGHLWKSPMIEGLMTSHCKWRCLTSSSIFNSDTSQWNEMIWLVRHNNEVVRLMTSQDNDEMMMMTADVIRQPTTSADVITISSCKSALWLVTSQGFLMARTDVDDNDVTRWLGSGWKLCDVRSQLGDDAIITHVTCSSSCVWLVTSSGQVWMRVGTKLRDDDDVIQQAWLYIDAPSSGVHFTQVSCSPSTTQVWALDARGCCYVRRNVTDDFPVGTSWEKVPGETGIRKIVISNHCVYGVSFCGNLLERCGIERGNPCGDYWKQKIAKIMDLTVTPQNKLWSINHRHQIKIFATQIDDVIAPRDQYDDDLYQLEML